jgi:hypothetical protein
LYIGIREIYSPLDRKTASHERDAVC